MDKDKTYKNGQKISELKNSILTVYYKSGNKKAEGKFIDEKFEGNWLFYSEAPGPSFRKAILPIIKNTVIGHGITKKGKLPITKFFRTENN